MGMDRQLSFSLHVPDYDLVQRKTLATQYFRGVSGSNDSTNLRTSVKLLENSLSVFPQLDFSIAIASPSDQHIGFSPIQGLNSSRVLILLKVVASLPDIIDDNIVIIASSSKVMVMSLDATHLLGMQGRQHKGSVHGPIIKGLQLMVL